MDPIVTGAVLRAGEFADKVGDSVAKETGGILARLFGPSADVMGAHWAEQMKEKNLARLLRKTEKRAEGSDNPGFANPRVAAQVFESASYADDEFVAEYLSGVMASSRTPEGKDDNGLTWSALVARLPSAALRLHFMLYDAVRRGGIARGESDVTKLHDVAQIVPQRPILVELAKQDQFLQVADMVEALMRESLIGGTYAMGPTETFFMETYEKGKYLDSPWTETFKFRPTIHGTRLFMWGLGQGRLARNAYLADFLVLDLAEHEERPVVLDAALPYKDYVKPLSEKPPTIVVEPVATNPVEDGS